MIKEITTYVENNISSLTRDTNLFAGHIPSDAPKTHVGILESGGGAVNPFLPDSVEKLVQVLVRAKTYFTARDLSYLIFDFLKSKQNITMPVIGGGTEYRANFIEALNVPQYIGQNENGLYEFSTNFIFRIAEINV